MMNVKRICKSGKIAGTWFNRCFARLRAERDGNIALTFALTLIPVTIAVGSSLDYVQAMNTQRRMQADLDAALVAAASKVETSDETSLKAEIGRWIEAEAELKGYYALDTDSIAIDKTQYTVSARLSANVKTNFMQIIGKPTIPVAVVSTTIGGKGAVTKNAFSMYLVLDRSGSMGDETNTTYTTTCYSGRSRTPYTCTKNYTKIESLKLAVGDLMTQLETADPDTQYVRTGAISYNIESQDPTDLEWGEASVRSYVEALTATGGTNSGDAMKTAYKALVNGRENDAHYAKSGLTPSRFIVFMTDGDNNDTSYDTTTKKWCDKARADKVTVYSVAFMAPTRGQALLNYCATTSADYFEAENTAQLVEAFKIIGETASKTQVRITQ